MQWTAEAEAAIKKVPFFVRKKVRARVEKAAADAGRTTVTMAEVKAVRARYLTNMASEVKGYQLDTCFGPAGCPNRSVISDTLNQKIEALLKAEDLLSFLKTTVNGELKFHHEFRIALADCPNTCSQVQIKDIGIIGAALPIVTDQACTFCNACVDQCRETAVLIDDKMNRVDIDYKRCLACGKCIDVCPTGTIALDKKGFRVQLGGKLGRHPQLAQELQGIYSEDEVVDLVRRCVEFYKANSRHGERFAEIFNISDFL
ncbi:MAG: 4Fe-4S binding protein [Deltaproteobacteria bacterium]|nr:4Fe-4S binding protein [Deltaproteobacteria bacterium]MBW2592437.1 4Fe-4S binding protein [Deltaproteobacteria bacterium]